MAFFRMKLTCEDVAAAQGTMKYISVGCRGPDVFFLIAQHVVGVYEVVSRGSLKRDLVYKIYFVPSHVWYGFAYTSVKFMDGSFKEA